MINKSNIKLIVSDLDGTLLNSSSIISHKTSVVLKAAIDKGIKLVLCSGRQAADIEYLAKNAGLKDVMVLSLNGSYSKDQFGNIFIDERISHRATEECLKIFYKYDVAFNSYSADVLINNKIPDYEKDENFWNPERQARRKIITHLYGQDTLNDYINMGFNKLVYVNLSNSELLQKIKNEMYKIDDIEVTSSWITNFEIMPKGINKGYALNKLIEKLNISKENVISFGDNDNDKALLSNSGYGVAVANALNGLKETADYVTLSNEKDGVAYFIENFIL